MLGRILFIILIFSIFIFSYAKYFEKQGIYYPTKEILSDPSDIDLIYEDISFQTEDNLKLTGWFIPAEDSRGVLIFCHGNAGNISHRLEIIEILHKLKLDILIFDYRGYGKSQGTPSEEGLYKDAQAAYSYLVGGRNFDKQSIVIYGRSIGANIAIDLAHRVKAGILISDGGFTSAYDMGRKLFPYLPIRWIISVKFDACSKIKDINMPKLIIHSKDDEIIPFKLGERLFEIAPAPKEFYQMRGGHNEAILLSGQEYSLRLNAFLERYLTRR